MPVMSFDSGLDDAFIGDDSLDSGDDGFMGFIGDAFEFVGMGAKAATEIGQAVDAWDEQGDARVDTRSAPDSRRGDSIVPTLVTAGLVVGGVLLVGFIAYTVFAR